MSLIGQIWLKLFLVLLLAFMGSVAVHTDAMRETLQTQLRLKNNDNATALALVLSQQKGDPALMELVMAAQFDTGFYRRIRFVGADGTQRFQREVAPAPLEAPGWFERLLPIEADARRGAGLRWLAGAGPHRGAEPRHLCARRTLACRHARRRRAWPSSACSRHWPGH